MAAPMSFRLYRSLISNTAIAAFSFTRAAESPFAAFVSARPRSHRLRYGFFAATGCAYCHATQKSCTVRPVRYRSPGRASRWHSQLHSLSLISLSGEPHSTDRNELLQSVSALHSRRRFYLFRQELPAILVGSYAPKSFNNASFDLRGVCLIISINLEVITSAICSCLFDRIRMYTPSLCVG